MWAGLRLRRGRGLGGAGVPQDPPERDERAPRKQTPKIQKQALSLIFLLPLWRVALISAHGGRVGPLGYLAVTRRLPPASPPPFTVFKGRNGGALLTHIVFGGSLPLTASKTSTRGPREEMGRNRLPV